MIKIGNVVYTDELVNHSNVNYVNYVNIEDIHIMKEELDLKLPTLFVGWNSFRDELLKFHDTSILDKKIKENEMYWEFSFNEKKSEHITGVDMFIRNVPYFYFRKNYKYVNLDPIFNKITNHNELMLLIPNGEYSSYQFKDEMLYLLKGNEIFGIDLQMYNYFNIDSSTILSSLTNRISSSNHDDDGSIYQKHYKTYPNFEELKRYLVVLLTKL